MPTDNRYLEIGMAFTPSKESRQAAPCSTNIVGRLIAPITSVKPSLPLAGNTSAPWLYAGRNAEQLRTRT